MWEITTGIREKGINNMEWIDKGIFSGNNDRNL